MGAEAYVEEHSHREPQPARRGPGMKSPTSLPSPFWTPPPGGPVSCLQPIAGQQGL